LNKYFQGAALMRECKNKTFFGGCGKLPDSTRYYCEFVLPYDAKEDIP